MDSFYLGDCFGEELKETTNKVEGENGMLDDFSDSESVMKFNKLKREKELTSSLRNEIIVSFQMLPTAEHVQRINP